MRTPIGFTFSLGSQGSRCLQCAFHSQKSRILGRKRENLGSRAFLTSRGLCGSESFEVSCAGAGRITVDVYNAQALKNLTAPLIIYIPPTGVHLSHKHPSIPSTLTSLSNVAIARVNYRWNLPAESSQSSPTENPSPPSSPRPLSSSPSYNRHPFPTPLHDTLAAFDFLTQSLLPSFNAKTPVPLSPYAASPSPRKLIQRPILLYGDFLGGTIATSVALTESHASKTHPFKISGLIAHNAIFDWTEIATIKDPQLDNPTDWLPIQDVNQVISKHRAWNTQDLHTLKSTLFKNPQSCFDNFASPFLFFRTAGVAVPPRWLGITEPESDPDTYITSILSDPEEIAGLPASPSSPGSTTKGVVSELEVENVRVSYLKFPPTHTLYNDRNLKLPRSLFLFSASPSSSDKKNKEGSTSTVKKKMKRGEETTPKIQAQEMKRLMQRSMLLYEFKERAMWDEKLDANKEADRRVEVLEVGSGEEETMGWDWRLKEWIEEGIE